MARGKSRVRKWPLCQNPAFLRDLCRSLHERSAKGDNVAAEQLGKLLAVHPELKPPVAEDPKTKAERVWTMLVAAGDERAADAVRSEIEALTAELLGPNPGLLDRILARDVAVNYLVYQAAAAAAGESAPTREIAAFRLRSLESGQRRLANALRNWRQQARIIGREKAEPPATLLFDPPPCPTRVRRAQTESIDRLEQDD